MENNKPKYHISLLKDITIVTALITILSYVIAYSYQKGFNSFYKIDEFFIDSITINQLLNSLITVGLTISFLFSYIPLFNQISKRDTTYNSTFMVNHILTFWVAIPIIVGFILLNLTIMNKVQLITLYVLYLLLTAVPSLLAALFEDKSVPYNKRFHKKVVEEGFSINSLKRILEKSPPIFIIFLLISLILTTVLSEGIGHKNASKKLKYYNLLIENVEYIVINKYNDSFIIAPYEKKSNTIYGKYSILDISDLKIGENNLYYVELKEPPKIKEYIPETK
ncbi:hypothetical protein ACIQ57_17525 [Lysinibacillus xylanilyticus]|uniref:hypothetical protein n=1 Tax=Lysinibacillus xylanilyticus TaxID=582475 RepID=UPI0038066CBF